MLMAEPLKYIQIHIFMLQQEASIPRLAFNQPLFIGMDMMKWNPPLCRIPKILKIPLNKRSTRLDFNICQLRLCLKNLDGFSYIGRFMAAIIKRPPTPLPQINGKTKCATQTLSELD